jgi:hypothetical protein
MHLLKPLAVIVSWFLLWAAIPAVLLYPLAVWVAKHTRISGHALTQGYVVAICLLFFPTGFLIDFLYRHFVRGRHARKSPDVTEDPN